MKVLSISTSSNIATAAIIEDEQEILELNINNNKTHSETLIPQIEELLEKTKIELKDINLIACDVGPRVIYRNKNWNCYCKGYCNVAKYSNRFSYIFRKLSI